jgi:hypothetical protein
MRFSDWIGGHGIPWVTVIWIWPLTSLAITTFLNKTFGGKQKAQAP